MLLFSHDSFILEIGASQPVLRHEIAMSHFESRKIDTQLSLSSSLHGQMELVRGEVKQAPAKGAPCRCSTKSKPWC